MGNRYLKASCLLVLSLVVLYVLNFRHGTVPPLGKVLNPFAGFWLNGTRMDAMPRFIRMRNVRDSVVVIWDDRRVPHIFAQNAYDLYFMQGFITARDRLWQMEFQADIIAGRLAGIVGVDFLDYDLFYRRCGIIYAAENALREILADPETRLILEAYTDGVNEYIGNLGAKDRPLEYKILDYRPEPWTFLKSALIAKFMAWNLTAFDIPELTLTHARGILGERVVDELYPNVPPFNDPVIPRHTRWTFQPSAIPEKPETDFLPVLDSGRAHAMVLTAPGSNNWAVASGKTQSGYPILCNDFHLPMYLPCMWYEIQLVNPEMNVYGASLPGAPLVTVGFNEHVAWGATNAMTDVIDWYDIEFKDETRSAYLHDSTWLPTRKRIEEIKIRDGRTIIDTVVYTHHGPVVYGHHEERYDARIPQGSAMRWVGHDASNEFKFFLELNRAQDYNDCREAIATYDCPGLNIVFAVGTGDIAIWHAGKFPVRWPGQGRYINDGRNSQYDWQEWIPKEQLPHIDNPTRGFVSSANQYPVDERYPYYLNGSYWSFDRGARINERLSVMNSVTIDSMINLQNDVTDILARRILPFLLASIDKQRLLLQERRSYEVLEAWDYEFRVDLIAPTIFTYWWNEISAMIWNDEMERHGNMLAVPRSDVTVSLMLDHPNNRFFNADNKRGQDRIREIVIRAFHSASNRLFEDLGSYGDNWQWGRARTVDIVHLARIGGLGRMNLVKPGSAHTINIKHSIPLGRSWRMVVSLGPEVKGFGIYPGGQSGNPGSRFYDDFIEDWRADKLYDFLYFKSAEVKHDRVIGRTVIRGLH
jgi:penicillin amidase